MSKQRLRILLLSPAVVPPHGGIARLTEDLFAMLSCDSRLSVRLLAVAEAGRPDLAGSVIIRGGKGMRAIMFVVRALQECFRRSPSVVHAMTWRAGLPIALLPRVARPQLVVHCHGSELNRIGRLTTSLRNLVLRRADQLIAVSRATAVLVQNISGRPATVVPNGIDGIHERPRTDLDSSGPQTIISVGRLVARKGHANTVRAVDILRKQGLDVRLLVVGEGPLRRDLEGLINHLGARDWCSIEGQLSEASLRERYASADVFVLLGQEVEGDFEGFGIAFLEAAAAGLPIVTTATGGALDAVHPGRNAVVVDGVEDAAASLRDVLQDAELRRRMSSAGREFVQRFSWGSVGDELIAVYSRLAARRRAA